MKKYHVIVFGCQMNISDSERVASVLEGIKYEKISNINDADLIVVVMCSVRQSAVDRVHGLAQKFKTLKALPAGRQAKTVLTGCVLKKDKKIFARLDPSGQVEGFDIVLDIKDIKRIPELLGIKSAGGPENYLDIKPKYESQFSANVPIMTGCNNFCAYCVVPFTREREISRPAEEIVCEIKTLVKNGYKEIWLLGQNVNSYKDGSVNFPKLLKMVNDIPGDFWIRFTSSHPKDFKDDVIEAMLARRSLGEGGAVNHITPYLNLPVQSGDDKVLKSMNRHYTIKEYKGKIKKLRKKIPGVSISTDIIVGFPAETKRQFENTAKLFRDVKYDMAYINKYSARSGTPASKLKDNVPWEEKKRREKVLTDILKKTALEHNKKLLGKETLVLINENRGGNYFGKNEHYKTIKIKSDKNILGKLVKAIITEVRPFILKGEIV